MRKGPSGEKRHSDTVQNGMLISGIATGDRGWAVDPR
jgi:hypothetical protein